MTVTAAIVAVCNAIVAIPKIGEMFRTLFAEISLWYINQADNKTRSQISDAAAFAARAQNDEERYQASQKWRDAFKRPRFAK